MQNYSLKFAYVRVVSLNAREQFRRFAGGRQWDSSPLSNRLESRRIKPNEDQDVPRLAPCSRGKELERLQCRRLGENIPAPMTMEISARA